MNVRTLTAPQRAAIEASTAPDALLAFVTIEHPDLDEPVRAVCDPNKYVHDGELFEGVTFDYKIVNDNDGFPYAELSVPNVDRRLGRALLDAKDRARVSMEILSSADFDLSSFPRTEIGSPQAFYSYTEFELVRVDADVGRVTGRLMLRDYSREPFPGVRATQNRLPGLFR